MFASGAAVGTEHFATAMLPPAYPARSSNIDHRRSKRGGRESVGSPRPGRIFSSFHDPVTRGFYRHCSRSGGTSPSFLGASSRQRTLIFSNFHIDRTGGPQSSPAVGDLVEI